MQVIRMKNIGFIGSGQMAEAMITGILTADIAGTENLIASAVTEKTIRNIQQKYGICTTFNNQEIAKFSDILILAVHPDIQLKVINEIKNVIKPDAIMITIAAGITLNNMEQAFGRKIKVIRSMPNTPALIGEGMSALCGNDTITETDRKEVDQLFKSFGQTEWLEESLMDAVPAISGSSPAYIYMIIEALADGGVLYGIPRGKAYRMAAQAVLGAAKMVLETGIHPGVLKDQVCTPGGTTIEAIAALERNQLRGTILAGMEACTEKIKTLSDK